MLETDTLIKTTCPRDCYDACGISVRVRGGLIQNVMGDREHHVAHGKLCAKCAIAYNGVFRDAEKRLSVPLRRVGKKGAGVFEPVTWDVALTDIAARLKMIRDPRTIYHTHYTGTMALTGGGASAGALQPLTQQNVTNDGIILVAEGDRNDRRMLFSWDRRRDGRRCSSRFGNCHHFHDGYYYETSWWTLPLIVGGSIAASRDYDDDDYVVAVGGDHEQWCLDRYRSFDPRTNTWVSYSGEVRECDSPYN
jgi:anaerobic selenocysteine-containing dehydrogenase